MIVYLQKGTKLMSRIALCALLVFAADLKAQLATGTLVRVDATGALVPNAHRERPTR